MKIKLLQAACLIIPLLFVSCEIDHGLGTMDSRINGKIIFLNKDKKPDYVESVRVVAVTKFPPENLGDVVFTNTSVNLSKDEPTFYIPAPYSSYQLVAAIWKKKGASWDYSKILGYYGFDPVTYTYEEKIVTLDKNHPVANNIDFYCDWTLLPAED